MKDFFDGKSVLITGINGFVGSWLASELIRKNANVVGLIRDMNPKSNLFLSNAHEKSVIVKGSITNYETINRILNEYEIEICFHLAALATVPVANRNPRNSFEVNIRGTWNVLDACRNSATVKGVIVASSDKAYGDKDSLPYTEEDSLSGKYPYDVSKACADMIAQSYYHTYNVNCAISRCGNIYGGGDLHFSRIIPGTIKSVLSNEQPVIRSDGTFKRDYTYIKDIVLGYLSIAEALTSKNIGGHAFNLSSGAPITVLDLVNKIIKISGSEIKPNIMNEAKGEIKDQYLSNRKAKAILGWEPMYSLDEGLKETISWYKNYFKI